MSIDERLRVGLQSSADVVRPDVEDRLAMTRETFRHRRNLRRGAVAVSFAAVGILAVTVLPGVLEEHPEDKGPVPATSVRPTPSVTRDEDTAGADLLRAHTWSTPRITKARVRTVLDEAGLGSFADAVIQDQGYPKVWTLTFVGDYYYVKAGEGSATDQGTFAVSGSTLTLTPSCACTVRLSWAVTGDRLGLSLLSDASPPYQGVPDEAFIRAIYTTVPFTRD